MGLRELGWRRQRRQKHPRRVSSTRPAHRSTCSFRSTVTRPVSRLTQGSRSDLAATFFVVWDSFSSPGSDDDLQSVLGRAFDASGTPLGPDIQINTAVDNRQSQPDIGVDSAGQYVATWSSGSTLENDPDFSIQARRLDRLGTPLSPVFQVNDFTNGNQLAPRLGVGVTGYLVAWESNGSPGTDDSGTSVQARVFGGSLQASVLEVPSLSARGLAVLVSALTCLGLLTLRRQD